MEWDVIAQTALDGVSIPMLVYVLMKLRFVEAQVSNHIPTSISELRERVDWLFAESKGRERWNG